jgi:NAD+ synthetase
MKIGIAQLDPVVGAIEDNLALLLGYFETFAAEGVDLVVTSELFLMGYPSQDLVAHPATQGRVENALGTLVEATRSLSYGVVVGAPWAGSGGRRCYNSVFLISDGQVHYRWDKQLLPFYDVFSDPRQFIPGGDSHVVTWRGCRLGVLICEDAWAGTYGEDYEANPIAQLAADAPDLVVIPTASPFEINKARSRNWVMSQVARQLGVPVVMVNQIGAQDDMVYSGASLILDGKGAVIFAAPEFEAGAFIGMTSGPEVAFSVPHPMAQAAAAIQTAICGYMSKLKLSTAVVGLSGGIDSAVTASLAVAALGADQVVGIGMPTDYSSPDSLCDARELADRLGIRFLEIPIQSLYATFLTQMNWPMTPVTLAMESLQARIRGVVVMGVANDLGGIVLSTGNKSELAMGYCTMYGDMNGALAPLSDLYKVEVFQLARWINRDQVIIPENTISRPPSAELRPDQTDQDSLPAYEVLDAILKLHIEDQCTQASIVSKGFDAALVAEVIARCHRNEYKRRQAAPGLKLSRTAFGPGRQIPILSQWGPL